MNEFFFIKKCISHGNGRCQLCNEIYFWNLFFIQWPSQLADPGIRKGSRTGSHNRSQTDVYWICRVYGIQTVGRRCPHPSEFLPGWRWVHLWPLQSVDELHSRPPGRPIRRSTPEIENLIEIKFEKMKWLDLQSAWPWLRLGVALASERRLLILFELIQRFYSQSGHHWLRSSFHWKPHQHFMSSASVIRARTPQLKDLGSNVGGTNKIALKYTSFMKIRIMKDNHDVISNRKGTLCSTFIKLMRVNSRTFNATLSAGFQEEGRFSMKTTTRWLSHQSTWNELIDLLSV